MRESGSNGKKNSKTCQKREEERKRKQGSSATQHKHYFANMGALKKRSLVAEGSIAPKGHSRFFFYSLNIVFFFSNNPLKTIKGRGLAAAIIQSSEGD